MSSARLLYAGGGLSLEIASANKRPRAPVISAVRPVANHFWDVGFKLLPSIGLLCYLYLKDWGSETNGSGET